LKEGGGMAFDDNLEKFKELIRDEDKELIWNYISLCVHNRLLLRLEVCVGELLRREKEGIK
jgi:hypothetical protein